MHLYFHHKTPVLESRRLVWLCALTTLDVKSAPLARAVALWPFVIVRDMAETNQILINHECIHLRQQTETLLIGCYALQLVDMFYIKFFKKLSGMEAYQYRTLEQECYRNQHNLNYLNERPRFAMFRYIKDKRKINFVEGKEPEVLIGESY